MLRLPRTSFLNLAAARPARTPLKAVRHYSPAPAAAAAAASGNLALILASTAAAAAATATACYLYSGSSPARRSEVIITENCADWPTVININPPTTETFSVDLPTQPSGEGRVVTSTHVLLSEEACEAMLAQGAEVRPLGGVGRCEINMLGANPSGKAGGEDRFAVDVLRGGDLAELLPNGLRSDEEEGGVRKGFWERWQAVRGRLSGESQASAGGGGDGKDVEDEDGLMILASVFDGHCGPETSELLRKTWHPTLSHALAVSTAGGRGIPFLAPVGHEQGASLVPEVIRKTFIEYDRHLIEAPLAPLYTPHDGNGAGDSLLPHPPPKDVLLASAHNVGSCAITALVDTRQGMLHVGNLGDCRAVAGYWDEERGLWRCEQLSEDAGSENPREQERLARDHPEEEEGIALKFYEDGRMPRILNVMNLCRSFGDSQFKLPWAQMQRVGAAFQTYVPMPHMFEARTPPYVSSEPDVVSTRLRRHDPDTGTGEELKFVILATDGLWGKLTSEEAASLVALQSSAPQAVPVPKAELPDLVPLKVDGPQRFRYPVEPLPGTTPKNSEGSWTFKEGDNAATHLIRNALSRGDERVARMVLSMGAPAVREMRDDITAVVLFFGEDLKARAKEDEAREKGLSEICLKAPLT